MKRTVARAVEIIAVTLLLALCIPTSVGGAASYVRIHGDSMYPTFNNGDTVVLVRDDQYRVGDIIAYRSEQLGGAVVIHRIIDVLPDGRFITQGDNNDFVDGYRPTVDDVLGKRVVRLPGAARVATALTGPTGAVVLVVGLWLLLFVHPRSRGSVHRRHSMRGRLS